MARIIVGSYMVRYPMGGMMSWVLQYLVGLHRLGHDLYFVEKSTYQDDCYDPAQDQMTSDPTYGLNALVTLLERFDLAKRWCFVDGAGAYHGIGRTQVEDIFRTADVFLDMGAHGAWDEESSWPGSRALIDGDPGFTQLKMKKERDIGEPQTAYDHYFTVGRNVGDPSNTIPTVQQNWRHLFHPVVSDLYGPPSLGPGTAFTTVMNWKSYDPVRYDGFFYGQKDLEFAKFLELPQATDVPLEVAVAGKDVPHEQLRHAGWTIVDAHAVTISYDSFVRYIQQSRGEFSVCKHGYVISDSGWFSDRSAVYLACGRPVVLQDTGFSKHLPCGEGLFAVRTADEAVEAFNAIEGNYDRHARRAREIAFEYLDAEKVMRALLQEIGV